MKLANYIDFNFIYTDRVKLNAKVIASACHNQYDKYNYVVQCFQKSSRILLNCVDTSKG